MLTLKDERAIDDYFGTLLDVSVQEHRKFLTEFKRRVLPKSVKNGNNGNNNNRSKGNPNKTNLLKQQNTQKEKVSEKGNSKQAATSGQSKPNVKNTAETISASTGTKKKTKYVNLYGEDGKMNDVVMLKGRHLCNCQAAKHTLINNCMQCGRIVCEQEGSGPCLFCGNLVCTEDELQIIQSSSQNGENLKKTLLKQGRPKGWEDAVAMRNRLLDYDRMSEKRTTVIDDESDYFRTNSVWLSDEERIKLKKIEEKMKEKKYASRRDQKITIDFTGRQVVEEASMNAEFEKEILEEISDTFAHSNQGLYSGDQTANLNFDDCDPNLSVPAPVVSTHDYKYSNRFRFICFVSQILFINFNFVPSV